MLRSTISERSTRAVNQERTEGITGNECVRACTLHNTAGDQTQHEQVLKSPTESRRTSLKQRAKETKASSRHATMQARGPTPAYQHEASSHVQVACGHFEVASSRCPRRVATYSGKGRQPLHHATTTKPSRMAKQVGSASESMHESGPICCRNSSSRRSVRD